MNGLVVIKDSIFEHVLCPFLPSLPDGHPCHPHLKKRQLRNGEILEVSLYSAAGVGQTWFSDTGSLVLEPGSGTAPYRPLSKTVHTPLSGNSVFSQALPSGNAKTVR